MGLRVVTPAAIKPVDPAEVEHQLATEPEQGAHVLALIAAATEQVETYTGRALINRTLAYTLDAFPCGLLELPRPPLSSISEIRYLDENGDQQILDDALYRVSTTREPGVVEPAYGESWPATRAVIDAVEIEYVAGYGAAAADVPAVLRQALVMMVGEWLEFREGLVIGTIAEEIPHAIKMLLNGERLGRLFAGAGTA